ncbi:hypothetical protein MRB53_017013 [Persea americana]|uniref:Uncharacterized protein n=1 Tax=Persea americana TaxID=3435 RepID=A0ACC2M4S3_PERAE|nr:hypothetical protein MRB53_017013 [Persea americana]
MKTALALTALQLVTTNYPAPSPNQDILVKLLLPLAKSSLVKPSPISPHLALLSMFSSILTPLPLALLPQSNSPILTPFLQQTTIIQPAISSQQNLPPKPFSKKTASSKPSSSNSKASALSFQDLPYDAVTEIPQRTPTPTTDTSNLFSILDNCSFAYPTTFGRNLQASLEDNSSSSSGPPPGFEPSLPPPELRKPDHIPPLEVDQPPPFLRKLPPT